MSELLFNIDRGWNGLPEVSQVNYRDTYFLEGESYSDWLWRVTSAYSNDPIHAERMRKYISNYWFHPSTPPSANAGTNRGLPISCFTREVEDSKAGIFGAYTEAFWLGAHGGGIGTGWSNVREKGHKVAQNGESSGTIPFLKVSDSASLAVSQGGTRRASEAAYKLISHPEIFEFIDIRKPTGDKDRRATNLHHGVCLTDTFMEAVENEEAFPLVSPKNGTITETIDAYDLFTEHLLATRVSMKGEPYILFIDTVNRMAPEEYKKLGIVITTSNLCSEITLDTSKGKTGVCALSSMNLEFWDEFSTDPEIFQQFIGDCVDFIDNMLQDFIDRASALPQPAKGAFSKAVKGASDERSLGLGVMGFHSLLQSKNLPFGGAVTKGFNKQIFSKINAATEAHQLKLNQPCPMAKRAGTHRRNIHTTAIAPTMSISVLCNNTSSGIEPRIANAYVRKGKAGTSIEKNKYLINLLKEKNKDTREIWDSITKNEGSVQHLDFLSEYEKEVFKTAYEIRQDEIVSLAGDRAPFIDQAQSINLFIRHDAHVDDVYRVHMRAWKAGVKSLYYLRSTPSLRAKTGSSERANIKLDLDYEECLSCQ